MYRMQSSRKAKPTLAFFSFKYFILYLYCIEMKRTIFGKLIVSRERRFFLKEIIKMLRHNRDSQREYWLAILDYFIVPRINFFRLGRDGKMFFFFCQQYKLSHSWLLSSSDFIAGGHNSLEETYCRFCCNFPTHQPFMTYGSSI